MPRHRLGVALLVPEPWRTEIDTLRRAAGDGALGRIPAHLTLVPPVNVSERDIGDALALLRAAAASSHPITVDMGPPTSFLPDNPVLYLPAAGPGVEAVRALREEVFRPPLHRSLAWPFVPHVTLCDEGEPARIEAAVTGLSGYRSPVTFDRVHLLREDRDDDGRRIWRPFADATLGGSRVVGRGGLELEITESGGLDPTARASTDVLWLEHNARTGRPWHEEPFALTARRNGAVVGTATGWTNAGVAHLAELVVETGVRGEGIGSHLLAGFVDLATRRGCPRLSLRTDHDSEAPRFYEARGWRLEAVFEDWVGGRTMAQMRRDL